MKWYEVCYVNILSHYTVITMIKLFSTPDTVLTEIRQEPRENSNLGIPHWLRSSTGGKFVLFHMDF